MKKGEIIADILDAAKIHHNISISWSKLPEYEYGEIDPLEIGGEMVEDFASDWENQEASDCGNRNLCECEKKRADGACRQHDIYRVYTTGRSGATLYWEKYWNGSNLSLPFRWTGDELEDMDAAELATVRREMLAFNEAIKNLMAAFYETCKDRLEDARAEKAAEEKAEKEYQAIKTQVLKKGCIKRLISEIL